MGISSAAGNDRQMSQLLVLALHAVDRLQLEYDVAREERYNLDPELELPAVVRPSIALVPRNIEAAPLTVAFSESQAVHVRFGRWYTRAFPATGTEDVSFEEERDRFLWRVLQLVEGRYREAIAPGPPGALVLQHAFWSPDGARAGGECKIAVGDDAALIQATVDWQPWLRRRSPAQL